MGHSLGNKEGNRISDCKELSGVDYGEKKVHLLCGWAGAVFCPLHVACYSFSSIGEMAWVHLLACSVGTQEQGFGCLDLTLDTVVKGGMWGQETARRDGPDGSAVPAFEEWVGSVACPSIVNGTLI